MAANLNKVSDKVRDNSKENRHRSTKQKEFRMKSKGSLAHRPAGRPPFMAWVELESKKERHPQRAEHSAADEELRTESIQAEKQRKLRKFQQDVKERVKALERVKQLQQLDKSYEAVTAEQKIIYQSSFPKRVPTSTKDSCVYREANYASLQVGISGSCKYGYSVVNDPEEVNIASELLDKQVTKVQTCTRHARKVLGSQIVNIDADQLTQLPGGVWNGPLAVTRGEASDEVDKQVTMEQPQCKFAPMLQDDCREITDDVKDMSMYEDAHPLTTDKHRTLTGAVALTRANELHVHEKALQKTGCTKSSENRGQTEIVEPIRHKVTEDLMRPGRLKEQSKKQEQKQLAVYRRLFMDIEREQVRENLRMKEHRKRMTKLKNTQEMQRKEEEYEIDEIIEERSQITQQKTLLEEKLSRDNYYSEIVKEHKKLQKEKELERYVHALHATLKEKLMKRKLCVPALCSCGQTIFDTNPETCANNCIFYKNHKGYAKALSSVLSTTDLDL